MKSSTFVTLVFAFVAAPIPAHADDRLALLTPTQIRAFVNSAAANNSKACGMMARAFHAAVNDGDEASRDGTDARTTIAAAARVCLNDMRSAGASHDSLYPPYFYLRTECAHKDELGDDPINACENL